MKLDIIGEMFGGKYEIGISVILWWNMRQDIIGEANGGNMKWTDSLILEII
jgi:hypothetical protein